MRNIVLEFIKKSGGGISFTALGLILISSLLISINLNKVKQYKSMHEDYLNNYKWHYIYLEALYYTRNEIYEETYYDLNYDEDVLVNVDFEFLSNEVEIRIVYEEQEMISKIIFDKECKCIVEENRTFTEVK